MSGLSFFSRIQFWTVLSCKPSAAASSGAVYQALRVPELDPVFASRLPAIAQDVRHARRTVKTKNMNATNRVLGYPPPMTVEELLRIPLGIFERIACSLETIAASCDKTERPPRPTCHPACAVWTDDGSPQRTSPLDAGFGETPDSLVELLRAVDDAERELVGDDPPYVGSSRAGFVRNLVRLCKETER